MTEWDDNQLQKMTADDVTEQFLRAAARGTRWQAERADGWHAR